MKENGIWLSVWEIETQYLASLHEYLPFRIVSDPSGCLAGRHRPDGVFFKNADRSVRPC